MWIYQFQTMLAAAVPRAPESSRTDTSTRRRSDATRLLQTHFGLNPIGPGRRRDLGRAARAGLPSLQLVTPLGRDAREQDPQGRRARRRARRRPGARAGRAVVRVGTDRRGDAGPRRSLGRGGQRPGGQRGRRLGGRRPGPGGPPGRRLLDMDAGGHGQSGRGERHGPRRLGGTDRRGRGRVGRGRGRPGRRAAHRAALGGRAQRLRQPDLDRHRPAGRGRSGRRRHRRLGRAERRQHDRPLQDRERRVDQRAGRARPRRSPAPSPGCPSPATAPGTPSPPGGWTALVAPTSRPPGGSTAPRGAHRRPKAPSRRWPTHPRSASTAPATWPWAGAPGRRPTPIFPTSRPGRAAATSGGRWA